MHNCRSSLRSSMTRMHSICRLPTRHMTAQQTSRGGSCSAAGCCLPWGVHPQTGASCSLGLSEASLCHLHQHTHMMAPGCWSGLCCAVLCCAVLCCAVLCCAMLGCDMYKRLASLASGHNVAVTMMRQGVRNSKQGRPTT